MANRIKVTKFEGDPHVRVVQIDEQYEVYMKWDGCIEIKEIGDKGSYHVCDVPRFIEQLQTLETYRMENIENAE